MPISHCGHIKVLSLCAANVCRLVLAAVVRDEVEENFLLHAGALPAAAAEQLLDDYTRLLKLTKAEVILYPSKALVNSSRHLIRHGADVPVLISAMAGRPDWLLTHHIRHFSYGVAQRTGLCIATPEEFFRAISSALR